MKTGLFSLKHHGRVGPGGWKCPCCGIRKGQRRLEARLHKKRLSRMLDKLQEKM